MKHTALICAAALAALAGCTELPKPQFFARAVMPLAVTADPVTMASGPFKDSEVIGRHKVEVRSGVTPKSDLQGTVRLVPAGTPLAEGVVMRNDGPTLFYCDVRPTDAFVSVRGETDCFEDTDNDGQFDVAWTGRPSMSLFTMSLNSAGFQGAITPAPFEKLAKPPSTEIGFKTFTCWNGQPAFVLAFLRTNGNWDFGSGPCAVGDHPGEVSKDGVFSGMGATIKVTGEGDAKQYEVIKRIPAGPIALGSSPIR